MSSETTPAPPSASPPPDPTGRTDVEAALLGGRSREDLARQRLSPAEERFERGRATLGWVLAPALAIVFALLPLGMDRQQQLLAAVLLGVIGFVGGAAPPSFRAGQAAPAAMS